MNSNANPIKINIIKSNKSDETDNFNQNDRIYQADRLKKTEKISRLDYEGKIAKICFCLLIFLLPLFFLPLTAGPLEINKQFLSLILVLIIFLCYIIRSINKREISYPKSWLSLAVLIFVAAAGLGTIFSQARQISIWGNFGQPDSFLVFLIGGLIFFLSAVFIKKRDLPEIGLCFFVSLLVAAIFGLFQFLEKFILPWEFSRQASFNTIGTPINWGIFAVFGLVMIIVVLVNLNLRKMDKRWKIGLSVVGLLILIEIALLNFQILWIGLALAMFLLVIFRLLAKSETTLPLIIIVISLFFILANQWIPAIISIPAEIRPNFTTTIEVLRGVLAGKRFLFGSGPATFSYGYSRFRPLILNQTVFWPIRFNQGASFFVTLPATLGILGVLSFLFIVFCFIRRSFEIWRDENYLPIIVGLSFLFVNLFIEPAFFVQIFFVFLGLGLLAIGLEKRYEIDFYSENKWRIISAFGILAGMIFLIGFGLVALYLSGQKYAAAVYYQKGLSSNQSLDEIIVQLSKAQRWDPYSDQYLRILSQALLLRANTLAKNAEQNQDIQSKVQTDVVGAFEAGRRAVELNPADSLNWSNLASVYEQIIPTKDADTFAEDNYRKVMEWEPNNPQAPVDVARVLIISADQNQQNKEIWRSQLDKAKIALEKSIELKSDYAAAHFLAAQIYIREGNTDKAIEKLKDTEKSNPADAGLAFQLGFIYYRLNKIELAQSEFERAVALDQNYSNARYFLGLIYEQKGQKQNAIAQFEKIKQFNPDNQEIDKILTNLRAGREVLEEIVPPAKPPAERTETPVSEIKNQKR